MTLTSVQTSTGSVLASIENFPGYFIDRDIDKVVSVKRGTPKSLKIRKSGKRGKSKTVTLSKDGNSSTVQIDKLRGNVKFRDLRPVVEANVYSRAVKLNASAVKIIRKSKLSQRDLADLYDVADSTISNVVNRKTWRWVK